MKRGYTLIELIIVVVIMMLLLTGVMAGYTDYTDSQELKQSAANLKQVFQSASSSARSGDQRQICNVYTNPLSYYQLVIDAAAKQYTYSIFCRDGSSEIIQTVALSSRYVITVPSSPFTVRYYPSVQKPTSLSADSAVILTLGSKQQRFTVSRNGNILNR